MAKVYSTCFYNSTAFAYGARVIGQVPANEVWVIRDVVICYSIGTAMYSAVGCIVEDSENAIICRTPYNGTRTDIAYHFEMRQVLAPYDELKAQNLDGQNCSLRISGYSLTTP